LYWRPAHPARTAHEPAAGLTIPTPAISEDRSIPPKERPVLKRWDHCGIQRLTLSKVEAAVYSRFTEREMQSLSCYASPAN
jgi:hypothetical protein